MFDKQVKTQLICDTFTLIGIRGYDKQAMVLQKKKEDAVSPPTESEPQFHRSMELEELESLGGCAYEEEANPEKTQKAILAQLAEAAYLENYEVMD
jgi:hypothetical protein